MATSLKQDKPTPQFMFLTEPRRPASQAMNGLGARPNVYKRSLEARRNTNAYLAEVERKAALGDEPLPREIKMKVYELALGILFAVAVVVGLWLSL